MPVFMLPVVVALLAAPAQEGSACRATPFGETCHQLQVLKRAARCVSTPFGGTCLELPAPGQPPKIDAKRSEQGKRTTE